MRLRALYACITRRPIPFNRCFTSGTFEGAVGFQPATNRPSAMLAFVDVNEAVAGPGTLGRTGSRP